MLVSGSVLFSGVVILVEFFRHGTTEYPARTCSVGCSPNFTLNPKPYTIVRIILGSPKTHKFDSLSVDLGE